MEEELKDVNIDVVEIQKILPHRFPFLLVDRVEKMSNNKVIGYKNVTINEWFFEGHFPGYPIMPGVLIIEGLAQCAGVLALKAIGYNSQNPPLIFFAAIDGVKFRNPVLPGDKLVYEVEIIKITNKFGKFKGIAKVGDKVCAEAEMMAAIQER
ncbi:MAG: 3-hydroxyacyl-ACP dehydratase FabZ [Brevinematales bacterium]|nr:3-hydroxyacyl-ACP dehydratase FabZ [Brevinematales bacterium]